MRSVNPGLLFRGKCVKLTAHGIESAQDVKGFSFHCSLEQTVLEEVRKSVLIIRLIATARANHESAVGDLSGQVLMNNTQSVAEGEYDGVVLHLRCENKDEGRWARGEVGEALILILIVAVFLKMQE